MALRVALLSLGMSASLFVHASDAESAAADDTIGISIGSASVDLMNLIADDTLRLLDGDGIKAQRIERRSIDEPDEQTSSPELALAGLDTFISEWADDAQGADGLLGNLKPVAEVVRDHQAFLMLETRNRQQLRTVFSRAHGAAGPMKMGGLSDVGQRDHLVAMMLMEAAGQDPTEYAYQSFDSLESLAIGLLTGEIGVASIPVSQALRIPLEGGIRVVATSSRQRQDVMKRVPTLISARIDMVYTDYIGLYAHDSERAIEKLQPLSRFDTLSSSTQWSQQIYELGLVDDYINEGNFTVNVLRELSTLRRLADLLD